MLYNAKIKTATLDALANRVSSVANVITGLLEEGFVPNKNKATKIQIGLMLIDAFNCADVLSVEQHRSLENLYNKFISL